MAVACWKTGKNTKFMNLKSENHESENDHRMVNQERRGGDELVEMGARATNAKSHGEIATLDEDNPLLSHHKHPFCFYFIRISSC